MSNALLWTGLFILVALPKLLVYVPTIPDLGVLGALIFLLGVIGVWINYSKSRP